MILGNLSKSVYCEYVSMAATWPAAMLNTITALTQCAAHFGLGTSTQGNHTTFLLNCEQEFQIR